MYDLLILWPQDEFLLHLLFLSFFNISFLFFASFKLSFPTDFLTWLLTCFVITTSNKNPQAKLTLHNLTWLYIIWFCENRKQFVFVYISFQQITQNAFKRPNWYYLWANLPQFGKNWVRIKKIAFFGIPINDRY